MPTNERQMPLDRLNKICAGGQRHAVGHGLARDAAQLCAGQRRKHGGAVFIPKRNRHNTKT